jgi:2-polyprenyl-3-methyl-5-hydroxy-6-metoxy-1,4-benzoquinol methylase
MTGEVVDAATKHEFSGARAYRSRREFARLLCRRKRVLHVGCVDAGYYATHLAQKRFLHDDLVEVSAGVLGVDVDVEGIARMLADGYSDVFVLDITTTQGRLELLPRLESLGRLDVILCGEVIEHVPSPIELMRGLLELSRLTGAEVVVTTPNPFYWGRFVEAIFRRETVHPDHNAYLSAANLKTLARKAGGASELDCDFYENHASSSLRRAFKHGVSQLMPCLSDGVIARFRWNASNSRPGA